MLRKTCIARLQETGLSRKEAVQEFQATRRALGITATVYLTYEFYKIPREKQRRALIALLDKGDLYRKKNRALAYAILRTTDATGEAYYTAKANILAATKEYGITPKEYYLNKFYEVPSTGRAALAERILKERRQAALYLAEKKHQKEEDTKRFYANIMQHTHRSFEETKKDIEEAGVTPELYSIFRFWELSEEERKTYPSFHDTDIIKEKFVKDRLYTRITMNHKDLFNEAFSDCMHRPWLSSVVMDRRVFKETFRNEDRIIFKPRRGNCGIGIQIYDVPDEAALDKAFENLQTKPFGTMEGYVHQHPKMQQLSSRSVNTIRFVTIRTCDPSKKIATDKVHFLYAAVRMSLKDTIIDNIHAGGAVAFADLDTGKIITDAVTNSYECYAVHPVTGAPIRGFQIPYFAEAKAMLESAILKRDIEGYYGWDIAIAEDGPLMIEGNNNPGIDVLQLPFVPEKKGMRYVFEPYMK